MRVELAVIALPLYAAFEFGIAFSKIFTRYGTLAGHASIPNSLIISIKIILH